MRRGRPSHDVGMQVPILSALLPIRGGIPNWLRPLACKLLAGMCLSIHPKQHAHQDGDGDGGGMNWRVFSNTAHELEIV